MIADDPAAPGGEREPERVVVRPALPADVEDFVPLLLSTGETLLPSVFGPQFERLARALFLKRSTLLSFEHCLVIESGGAVAGLALSYDHAAEREERLRTLFLGALSLGPSVLARLGTIAQADRAMTRIRSGDRYLAALAVHPHSRGRGLGSRLIAEVERTAVDAGASRVVLEVDAKNTSAARLYRRLGYALDHDPSEFAVRGRRFRLLTMAKALRAADGSLIESR